MPWITLAETHLDDKLSATEIAAFRAAAISEGQSDPIAAALASVTSLVRGYVASAPGVTLDTVATTIPDRLLNPALDLAVIDIMTRAGGTMIDPEGARAQAKKDAIKLLEQVAKGLFSIADPESGSESKAAVKPSYTPTRTRRYTRESQDGI